MANFRERTGGPSVTSRHIKDLLKRYLACLEERLQEQPQAVLACWGEVVGQPFAGMTRATAFEGGILRVSVRHSAALSILHGPEEKRRLLMGIKARVPAAEVVDIVFRIG